MNQRIYLDNNAATFVDPRVLAVLVQEFQHTPGNPSSTHSYGREAKARLLQARQAISVYLGCKPSEIIFTSGGTEGLNMVIRGLMEQGGHIVTSDLEHPAVYSTVQLLKQCSVTFLKDIVSPQAVKEAFREDTKLIALMAANNETGVMTDIEAIAAVAQEKGIPFVVDGVALLGKETIKLHPGISAMCFSGHKIHAPKGTGFSFVRTNLKFPAFQTGGSQEFARRGGTENLPGIIALAEAVKLLDEEQIETMRKKRDRLEQGITQALPFVKVNGGNERRVCNAANLSFGEMDGENLLIQLDSRGIAVSLGSACNSGAIEPSRVLLNMGVPMKQARASLRFSLSRFTTDAEIEKTIETVISIVKK